MESKKKMDLPTAEQLEQELKRLKYRHSFAFTLRSTVASLIVVAAIAVMISTMIMPVLRMGQPPIHSSLSASVALLSMMALQIEEKAVSLIWL